ncbi:MAG: hypothetical protein U0822_22325 [Anaerolineae bacterium]
MSTNEVHEMQLVSTHPSGAEEWHCPTCGRRVLLQSQLDYQRITLERGDVYALAWGAETGVLVAEKTVLVVGDATASHRGNKLPSVMPSDEAEYAGLEPGESSSALTGRLNNGVPEAEDEDVANHQTPLTAEMRRWLTEAGFELWWTRPLSQL